MSTGVFVAKEPFSTDLAGVPKSVKRGDLFPGNSPLVKRNPHLFSEVEFGVEQATKAPGEKRGRVKKEQ